MIKSLALFKSGLLRGSRSRRANTLAAGRRQSMTCGDPTA